MLIVLVLVLRLVQDPVPPIASEGVLVVKVIVNMDVLLLVGLFPGNLLLNAPF